MPILAYGITEALLPIQLSTAGVQGKKVETISEANLRCFVSHYDEPATGNQQLVREAAFAFNLVVQEVFKNTAVIPFRFPTLLKDASEISTFLREHSTEYQEVLSRLHASVQMEMQVTLHGEESSIKAENESGSQYLKTRHAKHQKLKLAAETLHDSVASTIQNWRQRETSEGLRCYALVTRDTKHRFLTQAQEAKVHDDIRVRITGPWPATEFFKVNDAERRS